MRLISAVLHPSLRVRGRARAQVADLLAFDRATACREGANATRSVHRLDQAERFLSRGPDGDTLVFEKDGQPRIPTTFGMLFARLRDAAKLPRVRLHDLRHTCGSLLWQSGADLKTVSTALGHSSVAITADTYLHVAPAMLQSAADSLGALIGTGRKASGE